MLVRADFIQFNAYACPKIAFQRHLDKLLPRVERFVLRNATEDIFWFQFIDQVFASVADFVRYDDFPSEMFFNKWMQSIPAIVLHQWQKMSINVNLKNCCQDTNDENELSSLCF